MRHVANTAPMISIVLVDAALVLTGASPTTTSAYWPIVWISIPIRVVVQILGHVVGNLGLGQLGYCGQG